jgi:hypothetical protein
MNLFKSQKPETKTVGTNPTPEAPNPRENLRLLNQRLQGLETTERELVAEYSAAERIVTERTAEFNAVQSGILTAGRPLADGDAAHEALNRAIQQKMPIAEKLGRHRELLKKARALMVTVESAQQQGYITELGARHRAEAVEFGENLAVAMEAAGRFQGLFDEAFKMFPHGGRPACPEAFYSAVRPLFQIMPRPGSFGHNWLLAFAQMYGEGAMGPRAQQQLSVCDLERERQLAEEGEYNKRDQERWARNRRILYPDTPESAMVVDMRSADTKSQSAIVSVPLSPSGNPKLGDETVTRAPRSNDREAAEALARNELDKRNANEDALVAAKYPGLQRGGRRTA